MRRAKTRSQNTVSDTQPPRELLSYEKTLISKVNEKHSVTSNGKTERLPLQEILIQKHIQTALTGSPHALNQITKAMLGAEKVSADRSAYEVQFGNRLFVYVQTKVQEAEDRGEDSKYIYPHPDDIIIDHDIGWDIQGVWNEETLKSVKQIETFCEVLLQQHFLEERLDWPPVVPCEMFPNDTPFNGSAFLLIQLIEQWLPKRFCMSDEQYLLKERSARRMTKRELLKLVHNEWKQIGLFLPRGFKTLAFKDMYFQLELLAGKLFDDQNAL